MQILLLDSSYRPAGFISERKALKLLVKEKASSLASWEEVVRWGRGEFYLPAILKLERSVPYFKRKKRFNRSAVFKRDCYQCGYCGVNLNHNSTLDHIVPLDHGGLSTWENCITACFTCNNKKGNRTPEQAKMKLLITPTAPGINIVADYERLKIKHPEWKWFIDFPRGPRN